MKRYDLIVVGAGPAGSTAAGDAARAGMKVLLLEKHVLPRHKTCGGGIPMVVGDMFGDISPAAYVENRVHRMRHTWQFGSPKLGFVNLPGDDKNLDLWMVQRSRFDYALTARAAEYGAEVLDGVTIKDIELLRDGVVVRGRPTDDDKSITASADFLIGADGATGVTQKAAGLRQAHALAIGMEVEHPHRWGVGHEDLQPDVIHLEYGAVPNGYAWIFPKLEHLNVGAGIFRSGRAAAIGIKEELEKAICDYLTILRVPFDRNQMRFYAHPLPLWNGIHPINTRNGRVLLAGDAAGLVNPLFGDGVLHAIRSGRIAVDSIVTGAFTSYTKRIQTELGANFDAALTLSRVFYQWPGLIYRYGITRENATHTAARLLSGDTPFQDVAGRVVRRVKRLVLGVSSG